ncbi:MAG: HAD family phosphatase [Bacteroidota bacterium]
MTFNLNTIKNIIFDYGGVIINIDFLKSMKAFSDMGLSNPEELLTLYTNAPLFDNLEKGKITPAQFRDELRKLFINPVTDEELDAAWNELILNMPQHRLDFLLKLKTKFRTFLLSNSNVIHYDYYLKKLQTENHVNSFEALFEKAYFSFDLGMRKPDAEIFLHVLNQQHLIPEETLFIDDSKTNTDAAAALGMQVYTLEKGEEFEEVLKSF